MKIAAQHQQPLTTAITSSTPGLGAKAETVYRKAYDLFHNRDIGDGPFQGRRLTIPGISKAFKNQHHVLATVTDMETGLFVQMEGILDTTVETAVTGPFMSYGKKFLEETKNPQLHNTAVKLWR